MKTNSRRNLTTTTEPKLLANIGLCDPKSPTNVGAVMRAVNCFQADEVYYTGERYDRAARYYTDTQNTESKIYVSEVNCVLDEVVEGVSVVCVELAEGATPLSEFDHPDKAYYIFGPEDGTISQDIIDRADSVVYVPTVGCLNLAATVNIVLYDRLVKTNANVASDELIKGSRNQNNLLVVSPK